MAKPTKIEQWLEFTSNAAKFDAVKSIDVWINLVPYTNDWAAFHDKVIGNVPPSYITDALYHAIPNALGQKDWPAYIQSVQGHEHFRVIFDYLFKPSELYGTPVIEALAGYLNTTPVLPPKKLGAMGSSVAVRCATTLLKDPPDKFFKDDGHPQFAASLHRLSIAAHRHSFLPMNRPTSSQWGPQSLYDEYGLPDEKDLPLSKALRVCLEYVFYQHALNVSTRDSERTLFICETHELFKRMNLSLDVFESLLDITKPEHPHTIGSVMEAACLYLIPSTPALDLPDIGFGTYI